jgi:hypothetical protein
MKIELAAEEIRFVLGVLGARPFNEVATLINKIVEQAQAQTKPIQEGESTLHGADP